MPLAGGGRDWMRMRSVGMLPLLHLTRRAVLAGLVVAGLVSQVRGQQSLEALGLPALSHTLRVFLDVLVPADVAPSAGALGIHSALLEEATTRANYPELLLEGVGWLDEQAKLADADGFALTTESIRERIVANAFAAEPGTLPRVFAEFIRQDVMRLYYAHPESWAGMIDGPPQPSGYVFPHLPPGTRS